MLTEPIMHLNVFYVLTLGVSALLFLYLRSVWMKKVPEIFFWIHFFIVSWSALMYMNLIFSNRLTPYVYYADWIVSTPLIMLALGLTAMYPLKKIDWPTLFAMILTQAIVIATGFLADISTSEQSMLSFFMVGNGFMLLIFYFVFGPLMQIAQKNDALASKYTFLARLLVLFWLSYPLVWIIGTAGYQIISPYSTNLLFVILPILCKPVFGIVDLYLLHSLKEK